VYSVRTSANICSAGRMTTVSRGISKTLAFNVNGFTMHREDSSRYLPMQVGLTTTIVRILMRTLQLYQGAGETALALHG
jgi:hypothetical protein